MSRAYDNTLRERRAKETREQILDAIIDHLAEGEPLTFANASKWAEVSASTVYRNFPNRDALFDAVDDHIKLRMRVPKIPVGADTFAPAVFALTQYYAENEAFIGAYLEGGAELREHSRGRRAPSVGEAVARMLGPDAEPEKVELASVVLRTVLRSDTWWALRHEKGLSAEQANEGFTWLARCLYAGLERLGEEGGPLVPEEDKARGRALREELKGEESADDDD